MPFEIVFTSVPRGLDGGSGFQPVRRTKAMDDSLAERLKLRSGYSHPFRQGDGRNPVVYFHRIERVAGGTHHVIARIADAGSDHTGRSNRLSHLLAVEASAVGPKLAGPASVALAYAFLAKWAGAPEERDPPTIIGSTRADPGPCNAWAAAGLDPGIAGDLAEAAMKGREVCLITPADQPDPEFVLRLFADALQLVQPAARWKVTFNTCEIEAFDATWRAVRADLPQAKEMRDREPTVVDLTSGARGSDGPYAAYARGDAKSLPWQPQPQRSDEDKPVDGDGDDKKRHRSKQAGSRVGDTPKSGQGQSEPRLDRGIKRRFAKPEPPSPRPRIIWLLLAAIPLALLLLVAVGIWWLYAPIDPKPIDVADQSPPTEISTDIPDPRRATDEKIAKKQAEDKAIKELRQKLESPDDRRTAAAIEDEANKMLADIQKKRTGPPSLKLGRGEQNDPETFLNTVLQKCTQIKNQLKTLSENHDPGKWDKKALQEAIDLQSEAALELNTARDVIQRLYEAELAQIEKKKQEKISKQQIDAYAKLTKLATHAVLPSQEKSDLDEPQDEASIDLGEFPVESLVEPTFDLAVPKEEYQGKQFHARVRRPDAQGNTWVIEFVPPGGDLDSEGQQPRPLATLTVKEGNLHIALTDRPNDSHPLALLRRCVLLVSAKRPQSTGPVAAQGAAGSPPERREVRFVKPTKVGPLRVDPFRSQSLKIPVPRGIASSVAGGRAMLPLASCEVKARFVGQGVTQRPPSGGVIRSSGIPLVAPLAEGVDLVLDVGLTMADATLQITPRLTGPDAGRFVSLVELQDKFHGGQAEKIRDKQREGLRKTVMSNEGMKQGAPNGMKGERLNAWFNEPFGVPNKMGFVMRGHGTIKESLDAFLKQTYAEEEKELKRARDAGEKNVLSRPATPDSFDEWYKKNLIGDKDPEHWKENFQKTVARWWDWFAPQFDAAWAAASETVKKVEAVRKLDCRIEAITSFAYDRAGKEYPVPLVEFGEEPPPALPAGGTTSLGLE